MYAWQFAYGEYDWRDVNNLAMTMYRKDDIKQHLMDMQFDSAEDFELAWGKQAVDLYQVGLCCGKSRIDKKAYCY